MVIRKRLALLLATAALAATGLVGCNNTGGGSGSTDPHAVLANKDARHAIKLAIDTQQMVDVILANGSTPSDIFTASNLVKHEGKDYTDLLKDAGLKHNKEKAKESWEKAKKDIGFDKVTLEILTQDTESAGKMAEFYQSELQNTLEGATVEIKKLPFKQQLELQEKQDFQLSMSGWSPDYPDPLTFLDTMVTGKQYAKQTGYSNKEFDKLIDEAKNETDINKSWELYAKAEKLMIDDGYMIPTYQRTTAYLQKPEIKGIVEPNFGAKMQLKWADVDRDKKEINLAETADIPSLDPSLSSDVVSSTVLTNIMEPLNRIDDKGEAVAGAAESWSKSEDSKTYTFKLRKDVKWSNGDEVTAKDFEYSWKRTLNPETKSKYAWILYDIVGAEDANINGKNLDDVGVKALDDHTLEVKLKRPVTYFEKLVYDVRFLPQNQKFVEAQGDNYGKSLENVVFNGPFTLSNWKLEDQFSLSKNPNYFDASTVKLNKINFKVVKETSTQVNLYEGKQIDRAILTAELVDKYKNNKELNHKKEAGVFYLEVNAGKGSKETKK